MLRGSDVLKRRHIHPGANVDLDRKAIALRGQEFNIADYAGSELTC